MKDYYIYLGKKLLYSIIFFVLAIFSKRFVPPKFPNLYIDFIILLIFFLLPYFFYILSAKNIFDIILFIIKKIFLPVYYLEAEIYRLKETHLIYQIFFPILAVAILTNDIRIKINIIGYSLSITTELIGGFILFAFLYHLLTVVLIKKTKIEAYVKKSIITLGEKTTINIKLKYPLPIFNIFPQLEYGKIIKEKYTLNSEEYIIEFTGKETGFYLLDLFEIYVITFPLLISKVYVKAQKYGKIVIVPKIKLKAIRYIRNPYLVRETGELIKKTYGSSLDFADIREYIVGDPPSRIWWKGYAKTGKLLTKEFYSFAEDRWIIILDLTGNIKKEEREKLLTFLREFIEVYTRKDIQISLHIFSKTKYAYIDYTSNKRQLISFLSKYHKEYKLISQRGCEKILKNAGINIEKVKEICKKEGISLSAYLYYNNVLKEKIQLFYINRDELINRYVKEFIKSVKKHGKLIIVTKNPCNEYKKITSKFRHYLIVSLKPSKGFRYILLKRPENTVYKIAYAV